MIPGLLAQDVARALREFIITGFETDTWPFSGKFEQLVNSDNNGEAFIKGPYVSVSLPFAKTTDRTDFFSGFRTENSPFVHQQHAWENLRSDSPIKSTLVATGTGSGKTECFMYPLLDHCLRHTAPGIKAIVIYPMNALAGDQAKRFASAIYNTPSLKGKIRVGLFVGGNAEETQMAEKQVITSKKTLRKAPPDILLTNYKMLDYLLMRPVDQSLWQHNTEETLKYLVVDELHTFDGAQGSDLAMLIRRLKARLKVKANSLICAGTSATLGSQSQMDDLAQYASEIFDTPFDRNSIVGESRESYEQFLIKPKYLMLDPAFETQEFAFEFYPSHKEYLAAQAKLFFAADSPVDLYSENGKKSLGELLKQHIFLHSMLFDLRYEPVPVLQLAASVKKYLPAHLKGSAELALVSFLSLLAHARGQRYSGEPFVSVRLQLWARELRRIVARVGTDTPENPVHLQFADNLKEEPGEIFLPAVQCNECHTTAWLTSMEQGEKYLEQDLRKIYTRFFASDKRVKVFLPLKLIDNKPPTKGFVKQLCTQCGHVQLDGGVCQGCLEEALVTVFDPDLNKSVRRGGIPKIESQRMCPVCQATSSLILFGSRAASLSSVAIHQMYADPVNDDKKLIAFSDSVQDVAHRAGFFAARTWQNNLRMAFAKTVTHLCDRLKAPVPLTDFFVLLPRFWLGDVENRERFDPINYIAQFIPPNMQTHPDYLELKENGGLPNPGNLIGQINRRLVWELLSEIGIRSLIGRSLDRTGVATLNWRADIIENAAQLLVSWCRENLGFEIPIRNANHMLWGIALRMKRQGAIYDPLMKGYIENGGDWYLLSNRNLKFMPNIGGYSILPRFPGEAAEKGLDKLLPKKQETWYSRWVQLLLPLDLAPDGIETDLLSLIMHSLVQAGLLLEISTLKGNKAWALNPEQLSLTTNLEAVRLRETGNSFGSWYVPKEWAEHLVGLPSLDHVSSKNQNIISYELNPQPRKSMYKTFYLNGEINRVIGHEHTALLEREYREELEQRFMTEKTGRSAWFENLLSATPTLEMGIDIGSLSSVMLCSVPPNQANYLQRAGRGGRRDGNSFVMTLANGHPHDLFFYADPLRMMAGEVQAPAIFLNAIMVLKRQLLAFCFDQWGMYEKGNHVIPGSMQSVLDAVENGDVNRFPYTLLDFISKNRDELWEAFDSLLAGNVTDATKLRLKEYLLSSSKEEDELRVYVLTRIKQLVEERLSLVQHQRDLEAELRQLKKKPKDQARDELEASLSTELEGFKRLKTDLNKKKTLNFFTDDGLLPNYAFPQEGTTLRSVIFRKLGKARETEDGKKTNYDSKVFEYSRPAQAALSELAPESVFYATNRKVKIERVEMARGENLEKWRLCPSCSFSEQIFGADKNAVCPRCQDPMWANVSQLMHMVRLRQVYANTSEDDAFISDDSDNREPTFYNRQMLIDFELDDIVLAYAMKTDTRPFGFEFIKKVAFKEINFGKQGSSDQTLNVAGVELARPGFKLCKECGMVQHRRNKAEHLFKCSYRNINDDSEEKNSAGIIDCLYLYRQYESEAIRILLPGLSVSDRDEQIQSFVAAIQLGLKARFGGKVDHINITTNEEPIPGSSDRANYLVLYDTVPGGTGYLHTLLADPNNFIDMLKHARQIMAECKCQNEPDLDGCYSCLYAYKNSYGMENTSRKTALAMLADILDENIELEKIPHIGKLAKNVWADSELESRFPEAIQSLNNHTLLGGIRVRTTKDIINGKVGFKLEVGDSIYSVEPHVKLGENNGVAYPCEPDFVFKLDREADQEIKIAVFLDGYQFHKGIIHEDLMKRQGIFLSTPMLVWSFTWFDINSAFAGNEAKIPNPFREHVENAPSAFIEKIRDKYELAAHSSIIQLKPLMMFIKFLSDPDIEKWRGYAMLRALSWLNQTTMGEKSIIEEFRAQSKVWPSQYVDAFSKQDLIFATRNVADDEACTLEINIAGGGDAVKNMDTEALVLAAIFDPVDKESDVTHRTWQKLLQIMNLGQFLPLFFASTSKGLQDGNFAQLSWTRQTAPMEHSDWDKVFKLVAEECIDLVNALANKGIELPQVGFEIENEKGMTAAEAELAWESVKLAILIPDQVEESKSIFENIGWTVLELSDDVEKIVEDIAKILIGGKT